MGSFAQQVSFPKVSFKKFDLKDVSGWSDEDYLTKSQAFERNDVTALNDLNNMFVKKHVDLVKEYREKFNVYVQESLADTKDPDSKIRVKDKFDTQERFFTEFARMLLPGRRVRVTLPSGETGQALVIGFKTSDRSANPFVPSNWTVTLAFPSGSPIMNIKLSQMQAGGVSAEKVVVYGLDRTRITDKAESFVETFDMLAKGGAKERRVIITGNILAGFDINDGLGQIINFTTEDGKIEQGILVNRKIKSLEDALRVTKTKIKTVAELKAAVNSAPKKFIVSSDDASVLIKQEYTGYQVSVNSARSKGGAYFLDGKLRELLGGSGFYSNGRKMTTPYISKDVADQFFARILEIGANFEGAANVNKTSYSVLRPALKTETAHVVPEAYKEFEGIIKRTLGEKARVEFVEQIKVTDSQAAMDSGGELDDYASGSNDRLTNMIYLATSLEHGASLPDATYHEAWHSLEDKLTPAERKAIADARPENNRLVAQYYGVPVEKIEALSTSEQDAYAMGMFGAKADANVKAVAMGRASYEVFGKVWLTYRRFRNVVNKLFGKKSMDSIFNDFYVGGMADRLEMETDVMADKMGVNTSDLAYMALRQKRKGPSTPQSYEVHEDTLKSELMYGLVDKYNDISMIQRAIEKARGSKLPETMDVEMSIGLFNNRVVARQEKVWDKELQPLLDEMAKLKIEEADLVEFVYARHAPERNAKMAKRDPKRFPHGGSGMENDDAQDIEDALKKKGIYDTLVRLDEKFVRPIIKADLKERLAAGLLTQDQYDEYTKPYSEGGYDFYVPLRGYAEQDADAEINSRGLRRGFGFSVSGKE